MNRRQAVFLYTPEVEKFPYPEASPFKTSRAGLTRARLVSMGMLSGLGRGERAPRIATRDDLETFHDSLYLDALEAAERGDLPVESLAMGLGTDDCPVFLGMNAYARLAAGASLTAADLLLSGEADIAFNPSGGCHHAHAAHASGFCYVNDVVLAATRLAAAGRRVLFLDVDAHHGDGVQDAFYDRQDVMTVSLHESGKTLFPGTGFEEEIGVGDGEGYCVNIPVPAGTFDAAYMWAFREAAWPLIRAFGPDVIILELGMDGLAGDPLAHLHLTNNVYADIVALVRDLNTPLLVTGGGGYHVANTVRGWALAWSVLCGEQEHDLSIGMGGVMLETTEWSGGLRDRVLRTDAAMHAAVEAELRATIDKIRRSLFPRHGL